MRVMKHAAEGFWNDAHTPAVRVERKAIISALLRMSGEADGVLNRRQELLLLLIGLVMESQAVEQFWVGDSHQFDGVTDDAVNARAASTKDGRS
ncbi:conserved hypothetical protein [Xanthomonas citri pv. fuscans]|nr:conserved hypothetical protein [Xanthomonas citri pv. fuscans]